MTDSAYAHPADREMVRPTMALAMLTRRITLIAAALVLCTASTARAEAELKINHFGRGAVAAFNVCTPLPNGDDLCEDFVLQYGRSGETRDGAARNPDVVGLEHFKAFISPDGSVDEFVAEVGLTDDVDGSYDKSRLTFASFDGATLDLNDIDPETGALIPNGRTATLGPFAWTAASDIHVFGNDGPFGFGLPRHFVDRCVTQIENAHERFTAARVTGTIDGVSVDAYGPLYLPWPGTGPDDALGAIYDNRFTVIVASHAPGC
jgi:hypothetical protein